MTTRKVEETGGQFEPTAKSWDETREWIGRELGGWEGVEPVEWSTIRRQLEVLEFDCPLHYDEKVAQEVGYEGVIAPYHMVNIFSSEGMWMPGDPPRWTSPDPNFHIYSGIRSQVKQYPMPADRNFATDLEIEYFKPLYIGDRLIIKENHLVSVLEKDTRVGRGAFLINETRFYNQKEELVAIMKQGLFAYFPHGLEPGSV